ncbi:uncharacterized protein LAESUDRAFT_704873 [Laetiporus sulphureus 93-53]|uniref:F-box domain-containing protein n=1 Tax=Laetiporus sulphureus 93-53 TaxID=1314785 RepID=A0A165CR33_9APHY|nr:uncharacterized protein LAESUDRAFT_704873 [Laetiporus sulphureus 93-53]KZT03273.1 hypothetical protein LAESUDRAFT_704873 [Laetiporus sulphureus 93-53]
MGDYLGLPSPRLPFEICDYILDHLWDDRKTLKVCSRVTREWLPTTRKHLFHFIRIVNDLELVAFEDVMLHSRDAVALCVRTLDFGWDDRFAIPAFVPQTLASFGRLEELTLRGTIWNDSYFSAKTIRWPILPMVKALHLHIRIVDDVVSLQRFICACPSLSSLKLQIRRVSECDGSHTHPPVVIPGSIAIETFQCGVHAPDPLLSWLLQGGLKLRMRRLAITVREIPASVKFLRTGDVQGLLRASGECLEHLVLNLPPAAFSRSPDGQQAALMHNPNLVSVYVSDVGCHRAPGSGAFSNGWTSLLSILADIQPMHARLQSIDIKLVTTSESDITSMPCEQLDAALARIVDTHPQLIFAVWIACDLLIPAPWLAEFVGALLQGLVRVQAGRGRFCLMWLNGCDEVMGLGHRTIPSWCSRW